MHSIGDILKDTDNFLRTVGDINGRIENLAATEEILCIGGFDS